MYDSILLPTDASAGMDRAIEHAVNTAKQYDAALHVLYVVDTDTYSSYSGDEYVHEFEGARKAPSKGPARRRSRGSSKPPTPPALRRPRSSVTAFPTRRYSPTPTRPTSVSP